MAGMFRKIGRFYGYALTKPLEQIYGSARSVANTLRDSAGNPVDKEEIIPFDEVLTHREEVSEYLEAREQQRQRTGRRTGLMFFVAFAILSLWGLFRLLHGAIKHDPIEAKNGASDFAIGALIALGSLLWIKSYSASRVLLPLKDLLRHFIILKRILIILFAATTGFLVVNLITLHFLAVIVSASVLTLILSWDFRFSLRIWQLKKGTAASPTEYFKEAGYFNLFDLEIR